MKPSPGRATVLGVGAAVLLAATAACSSDRDAVTAPPFGEDTVASLPRAPDGVTPAGIESVTMVGDSITLGSEQALLNALNSLGLDEIDIDAENGRRLTVDGGSIGSGVGAVADLARRDPPDLWVIALGTNDVANIPAEEYAAAIAELLAAIPADTPIVWVDTYLDGFKTASAEFNTTLRALLGQRGQATVVDWASTAEQDGVLTDGIHPSGYGIEQFSEMVTAAVNDWMA
jgi:lysophospholipase L1-like esterase